MQYLFEVSRRQRPIAKPSISLISKDEALIHALGKREAEKKSPNSCWHSHWLIRGVQQIFTICGEIITARRLIQPHVSLKANWASQMSSKKYRSAILRALLKEMEECEITAIKITISYSHRQRVHKPNLVSLSLFGVRMLIEANRNSLELSLKKWTIIFCTSWSQIYLKLSIITKNYKIKKIK